MPSVYHFDLPKKSEPPAKVPLHVIPLNMTSTTVEDIVSLPAASKARYREFSEYSGALHPFDGWVAKFGLLNPFGYVMWGFSAIPSWLMMIIISGISRQFMSRRMTGGQQGFNAPGQAQPQAQTPGRAAPAAAAAPRSGGGKKRK